MAKEREISKLVNDLGEEAFKKYEKLSNYFNKSDVSRKIQKYHDMGMNDEKVLEQIGKELHKAEEIEHEFHIHGKKH